MNDDAYWMAFHDAIEQSPRSSGIRTSWIVDPPNGQSRCALGAGDGTRRFWLAPGIV
jgi:hypothetical protein